MTFWHLWVPNKSKHHVSHFRKHVSHLVWQSHVTRCVIIVDVIQHSFWLVSNISFQWKWCPAFAAIFWNILKHLDILWLNSQEPHQLFPGLYAGAHQLLACALSFIKLFRHGGIKHVTLKHGELENWLVR